MLLPGAFVLEPIIVPAGVRGANAGLGGSVVVQNGELEVVAGPPLAQLGDVHRVPAHLQDHAKRQNLGKQSSLPQASRMFYMDSRRNQTSAPLWDL